MTRPCPTTLWSPGINRAHRHAEGLIGCWSLREGGELFPNLSGQANAGEGVGSVSTVASAVGPAVELDGLGDRIDCGFASILDVSVLTVCAWVYPSSPAANAEIVTRDNGSTERSWRLGIGTGTGRFSWTVYVGGSRRQAQSAVGYSDDEWHRVVGVSDGTLIYLYVDGVLRAGTVGGAVDTDPSDIFIGSNSVGGALFSGRVADVRIYDHPWSEDQVEDDFANAFDLYRLPLEEDDFDSFRFGGPVYWHRFRQESA